MVHLVRTCLALNVSTLKALAVQIVNKMIKALTACIEELDVKVNTCETRLEDDILKRLNDSLLVEEYMEAMKELVSSMNIAAHYSWTPRALKLG